MSTAINVTAIKNNVKEACLEGFTDDLGVLVAALAAVGVHVKSEHSNQAQEKLKQWFD